MKKFTFIFGIILATSVFLTSCSDASVQEKTYTGTEAYLNTPEETLFEQTWDTVESTVSLVTIVGGDNLWDISAECSGNPYRWEEVYYMNLSQLWERKEYKLVDGEMRPWVWIYPGEQIYVPGDFSSHRLQVIKNSIETAYYVPTQLDVKIIDLVPGLNAKHILLLDQGQDIHYPNIVAPTQPALQDPVYIEKNSGFESFFLNDGGWIIFVLLLVLLLYLLTRTSGRGNRTESITSTSSTFTAEETVSIIKALESFTKQAQQKEGEYDFSIGEETRLNLNIPHQTQTDPGAEKPSDEIKKEEISDKKE